MSGVTSVNNIQTVKQQKTLEQAKESKMENTIFSQAVNTTGDDPKKPVDKSEAKRKRAKLKEVRKEYKNNDELVNVEVDKRTASDPKAWKKTVSKNYPGLKENDPEGYIATLKYIQRQNGGKKRIESSDNINISLDPSKARYGIGGYVKTKLAFSDVEMLNKLESGQTLGTGVDLKLNRFTAQAGPVLRSNISDLSDVKALGKPNLGFGVDGAYRATNKLTFNGGAQVMADGKHIEYAGAGYQISDRTLLTGTVINRKSSDNRNLQNFGFGLHHKLTDDVALTIRSEREDVSKEGAIGATLKLTKKLATYGEIGVQSTKGVKDNKVFMSYGLKFNLN